MTKEEWNRDIYSILVHAHKKIGISIGPTSSMYTTYTPLLLTKEPTGMSHLHLQPSVPFIDIPQSCPILASIIHIWALRYDDGGRFVGVIWSEPNTPAKEMRLTSHRKNMVIKYDSTLYNVSQKYFFFWVWKTQRIVYSISWLAWELQKSFLDIPKIL
jgi:hypothetical protein